MRFGQLLFQNIVWRSFYFLSILTLNIFLARHFKAGGAGWIYYVINNVSFVLLVTGLSLESAITYFDSKGEISNGNLLAISLIWSLTAAALSIVILSWFSLGKNALLTGSSFFIYVLCCVLGSLLINYLSALFFAKRDFFTPNFILGITNIALALFFFLSRNNDTIARSFASIYFAFFLLQGVILLMGYLFTSSPVKSFGFPIISELKSLFRYSFTALAANIIFFLVYRVDYWFVNWYCPPEQLGNYIQVSKLVQLFLFIPTTFAGVVFPYIAGNERSENKEIVKILCRVLFTNFFAACIILALMGKWFFPWIFGKSFNNMYLPFIALIPGILSLAVLSPVAAYFAGQNKVYWNVVTSCIGLGVIIVGDIIFIPRGGIIAAAIVSSVGYFSCVLFSLRKFANTNKTKWKDILILRWEDIQIMKNKLQKQK